MTTTAAVGRDERETSTRDSGDLHSQCAAQQSGWVAGTPEAGEATDSTVDPRGALRLCRVLEVQAPMSVTAGGHAAVAKRRDSDAIMTDS